MNVPDVNSLKSANMFRTVLGETSSQRDKQIKATFHQSSLAELLEHDDRSCKRCGRDVFMRVAPNQWPIQLTAIICFTCGYTFGFMSEQILEELVCDGKEQIREVILVGLENGLTEVAIAEIADLSVAYVHAVAVNEGYVEPKRSVQ